MYLSASLAVSSTILSTIEKAKNSSKITLAYSDIAGHKQRINFDLNPREKAILPHNEKELIEKYDLPPTKIHTMDLAEIMAEKIRALLTRGLSRDLYDIWFLSKNHVKIDTKLAEQKLAFYKEKLETEKIKEIEATWKRDLDRLTRPVPEYDKVAKEVVKLF